jgi:hypothetical protein
MKSGEIKDTDGKYPPFSETLKLESNKELDKIVCITKLLNVNIRETSIKK